MISCDFYNFPSIADEAGACVSSASADNDTVKCEVYIASIATSRVV